MIERALSIKSRQGRRRPVSSPSATETGAAFESLSAATNHELHRHRVDGAHPLAQPAAVKSRLRQRAPGDEATEATEATEAIEAREREGTSGIARRIGRGLRWMMTPPTA
jgi:hypothetical protein